MSRYFVRFLYIVYSGCLMASFLFHFPLMSFSNSASANPHETFKRRWRNDTHFDSTLLIVQINFDCPVHVILTHHHFWKPIMQHIVYYGPFHEELRFRLGSQGIASVHRRDPPNGIEGMFQYRSALDAMKKFPYFDGYLFLQDDFHIDINSVRSWNLSNLWKSSDHYSTIIPNFQNLTAPKDWWWAHSSGYEAVLKILKNSNQIYSDIVRCTGSNDTWTISKGDLAFFYIPRAAVDLRSCLQLFQRTSTFC